LCYHPLCFALILSEKEKHHCLWPTQSSFNSLSWCLLILLNDIFSTVLIAEVSSSKLQCVLILMLWFLSHMKIRGKKILNLLLMVMFYLLNNLYIQKEKKKAIILKFCLVFCLVWFLFIKTIILKFCKI
jgi:hypothetical protein